MNITINGVRARVKAYPMFPLPPSTGLITGFILTVIIRRDEGQAPDFFEGLIFAFKQIYPSVAVAKVPETGYIEFRVLDCDTELKAIDLMHAAGYRVEQQIFR